MTPAVARHHADAYDIDQASHSDYFLPRPPEPRPSQPFAEKVTAQLFPRRTRGVEHKLWLLQRCTSSVQRQYLTGYLQHHIVPLLTQVAETYGPQFPCEKQIPGQRSVHRETGLKHTLVDNIGLITH